MKTIFGYGSLINGHSLRATVSQAQEIQPAFVCGWRRVFNFWDANGWTESNLDLAGQGGFCAVNVERTASLVPRVNGVVFTIEDDHFKKLLKREEGYSAIETDVFSFSTSRKIGHAMMFVAKNADGQYDFESASQQRYLDICLEAAMEYGPVFYEQFLRTTFIGEKTLPDVIELNIHKSLTFPFKDPSL